MALRGRPRAFDREQALHVAMLLFWERGYDNTQVTELALAMDIRAPSFYAAFGSKEALFLEALELYRGSVGARTMATLRHADARAALQAFLHQSVDNATQRAVGGCMIMLGAQSCASADAPAATALAALRRQTRDALRRRLRQAVSEGALAATAEVEACSDLLICVIQGISLQARDGARRGALERTAAMALDALPWATAEAGTGAA